MLCRLCAAGAACVLWHAAAFSWAVEPLPAAPVYAAQVINPSFEGGLRVPGSDTLLAWGSVGTLLRSGDGLSWAHADTPATETLRHLASDAFGRVLIAVGDQGTVLRSVDGGQSWQPLPSHTRAHFKSAVFHPGGDLFAVGQRLVRLARQAP